MYRSIKKSKKPKGSVIVFVLGIIALLSFILVSFMDEAVARIKYYGLFYHRNELRVEAISAFETTLAVINEIRQIDKGLYSTAQGWGNPLKYAEVDLGEDISISVSIEDESSKLSLPFVLKLNDFDLLRDIFIEFEIDLVEAGELASSILDWTDRDDGTQINGAEKDYYENQSPPYQPPNDIIKSWEEIKLIKGFDTAFFDEEGRPNNKFRLLKDTFSIYYNGKVNIQSANQVIRNIINRIDGYDTESLFDYIAGDDGEANTEDDRFITGNNDQGFVGVAPPQNSRLFSTQVSAMKVNVTASRGEASFLISALVTWKGSSPSISNAPQPAIPRKENINPEVTTIPNKTRSDNLSYPFEIIRMTENFNI